VVKILKFIQFVYTTFSGLLPNASSSLSSKSRTAYRVASASHPVARLSDVSPGKGRRQERKKNRGEEDWNRSEKRNNYALGLWLKPPKVQILATFLYQSIMVLYKIWLRCCSHDVYFTRQRHSARYSCSPTIGPALRSRVRCLTSTRRLCTGLNLSKQSLGGGVSTATALHIGTGFISTTAQRGSSICDGSQYKRCIVHSTSAGNCIELSAVSANFDYY